MIDLKIVIAPLLLYCIVCFVHTSHFSFSIEHHQKQQYRLGQDSFTFTGRPDPKQRKFKSEIIEQVISNVTTILKDKQLADMFQNCFPNTLDTTVESYKLNGPDSDAFIVTGDIKAMWLRDSTNQVIPYLPFVTKDQKLRELLIGVINRQSQNVLLDSYANAFYNDDLSLIGQYPPNSDSTYKVGYLGARMPAMSLRIHERKYELDSICAFLKLSTQYFEASNDSTPFIHSPSWIDAISTILQTMEEQQRGTDEEENETGYTYWFSRSTNLQTETLKDSGKYCSPSRRTGMIKTAFRPSDDACTFSFNIPQNAMCVVQLQKIAQMIQRIPELYSSHSKIAQQAIHLASQIDSGIKQFGIVNIGETKVYAFEVDGFGSFIFMDDANVPSLLSLPYLGYTSKNDPIYKQTRELLLSPSNPYYFCSKGHMGSILQSNVNYYQNRKNEICGIGSPHTGYNSIWPMSMIVRACTSDDDNEILQTLEQIKECSPTHVIHESFHINNVYSFTRPWFSWANSFFADLILKILREKPHLLLF